MNTLNPPDPLLAAGREALIAAAFCTGDFDRAGAALDEARQAAEARGDDRVLAGALDQLGFLQHWKNLQWRGLGSREPDVDTELSLFEQALAMRREIGDNAGVAESLFHVGLVHQIFKGDWDTAQSYFEQARGPAEVAGDDLLLSEVHRHIGAYYWIRRVDFTAALEHLQRSLDLRERLSFRGWLASGLLTLGQCELAAGRSAEALEHLREGVRLAERTGMREWWTISAREALRKTDDAAE